MLLFNYCIGFNFWRGLKLYNCMKKTLFVYFLDKGNVRMLCLCIEDELDVTGETLFMKLYL